MKTKIEPNKRNDFNSFTPSANFLAKFNFEG